MTHRPSRTGLLIAAWLFLASITPSLVPRSWYMQAAASGICLAYGYGLGVLLSWAGRKLIRLLQLRISVSPLAGRILRVGSWTLLIAVLVTVWLGSVGWQRQTARLVGLPTAPLWSPVAGLVGSLLVGAGIVLVVRGLRTVIRRGSSIGQRFLPRPVAWSVTAVLVAGLVLFVSDDVLYQGFMDRTAAAATSLNATAPDGRQAPTSGLRSGGPGSTQSWSSLGRNGQAFVSDGSSVAAIAATTGRPAVEPIRAYAGLSGHASLSDAADAVVAELWRTKAFDRDVLAVMTTTGRGWVDEWAASSIEYLTGGDCAIAAMQYSDLPSFVALLADRRTPVAAGRLLFSKVYAQWSQLPLTHRPRLVLGGESLGAYGGQAAFNTPDEMLSRIDGAVWVGTPNFTPLWRELTEHRQGGSPEIAPVVDGGAHIRFATRPADLTQDIYGRDYPAWNSPRIVYAQHASDPITWWSTDLLDTEPDWLRERVGHDVNDMRWASFATFWQLTTDLLVANGTGPGHGHRYQEELVPAWAAVLGLEPAADYSHIQTAIARDYRPV